MELLLHWMRNQEIDDKMLWKKAAINQEVFIRDEVCRNLLKVHSFVVSSHMSKSILLPVYSFTMRNGIKVICRENFYGWMLTVMLPKDRPYANIIPTDLLSRGYSENTADCYFEGFRKEWVYEGYHPDDIKQRNFSFGIYSDYEFYTVMYMLSHLYEEVDYTKKASSLTKENVVNAINKIYADFGYNDIYMDSFGDKSFERRVISGWEILWDTYKILDDYDFKKEHGIEYEDIKDVDDEPEKFADFIIKYPVLSKAFVFEAKSYGVKL